MNIFNRLPEPPPLSAAQYPPVHPGPGAPSALPPSGFSPGPFFNRALSWVDVVLTPQNAALAGRGLHWAARFPRRHPLPMAVLGASALYWAYRRAQPPTLRDTLRDFSRANSQALQNCAQQTRRSAAEGFSAATAAGRGLRGSAHEIRETMQDAATQVAENSRLAATRLSHSAAATAEAAREAYEAALHSAKANAEKVAEAARQLQVDAEAACQKVGNLARQKPALALAGGFALALGALLLAKSSRR